MVAKPRFGYCMNLLESKISLIRTLEYDYENKTLDLIYNLLFVLQDISTSIAYSILCNKKVYLIVIRKFYSVCKLEVNNLTKKIETPFVSC